MREKRESKAIGIEAIHELPGIDNLRLAAKGLGFRQGSGENRAKREPGRRSRGGGGRRIEVKKAISGGSERDDVVAESRASKLGEFVFVIEKMRRNTAHFWEVTKKSKAEIWEMEKESEMGFRVKDEKDEKEREAIQF